MERIELEEQPKQNLCKRGLVIERCSGCIMETLCHYEEMIKRVKEENKDEE